MMDADAAALQGDESGRISALRESRATGIDEEGIPLLFDALQVGVTVENGIVVPCRMLKGGVAVAVGEKISPSLIDKHGVGTHHVEVEEHLIDLRVTVAANGDDVIGMGVETLHDGGSIKVSGYTVARAIVEQIAEQDELVETFAVEVGQHLVKRTDTAMDVGDDEVFQGFKGY